MELYTSLTRLKMAMNGGQMPPMTPLTEKAKKFIDPAFTPGMGSLEEDAARGLRCPVRMCGQWFHYLKPHLNNRHRAIGGHRAVLAALSIPQTVKLNSSIVRERQSKARKAWWDANGGSAAATRRTSKMRTTARAGNGLGVGAVTRRVTSRTVGARNLRDICEAQLAHRIVDLGHSLGREPAMSDARRAFGSKFLWAVCRVFGTWNNAKAHVGMRARKGGMTADELYDSFKAYHNAHGCLPSWRTASAVSRAPLVPHPTTVLRVLRVASWPVAMSQVALMLGVSDHRYSPKVAA